MKDVTVTPEMQEVFSMVGIENDPHQQSRVVKVFKACPDVDVVFEVAPMVEWHKARKGVKDFPRALMNWCSNTQADINSKKAAGTYKPALRSVGGTGASQPRPLLENVGLTDDEMAVLMAGSKKKTEQARSDKSHEDEMPDEDLDEILRGIV